MSKVIVYQGANEQYRWRLIDADGNGVREDDGTPIHSDLFDALEDCLAAADDAATEHGCEVENRVNG